MTLDLAMIRSFDTKNSRQQKKKHVTWTYSKLKCSYIKVHYQESQNP